MQSAQTTSSLQLLALVGDRLHAIGSGVLLTPEIGLTAAHCLTEARTFGSTGFMRGDIEILQLHFRPLVAWEDEGGRSAVAHLLSPSIANHLDLATFRVHPVGDYAPEIDPPVVRMALPEVGETIYAVGYWQQEPREVEPEWLGESGRNGCAAEAGLVVSPGQVVQVLPEGQGHAKWPSFYADCAVMDGMSGGPVFDAAGQLLGIVSRSLPSSGPGDPHTTTVTSTLCFPRLYVEYEPGAVESDAVQPLSGFLARHIIPMVP